MGAVGLRTWSRPWHLHPPLLPRALACGITWVHGFRACPWALRGVGAGRVLSGTPCVPQVGATPPAAAAHGQLCPGGAVCRGCAHPAAGVLLGSDPGEPAAQVPHPPALRHPQQGAGVVSPLTFVEFQLGISESHRAKASTSGPSQGPTWPARPPVQGRGQRVAGDGVRWGCD